ncbi:MAG: YeeE/YedE thiosulfate transporter family protein [Chthoniobacterales bacterium]
MREAWIYGAIGGALIGLGSLVAMAATNKVPGISGVFGRLFRPVAGDSLWRVVFLAGMIGGACLLFQTSDFASTYRVPEGRSWWIYAVAGALVGFGTRWGGGCTSGHGVCGSSMGSRNSMVATGTFMLAGIVTVFVFRQLTS